MLTYLFCSVLLFLIYIIYWNIFYLRDVENVEEILEWYDTTNNDPSLRDRLIRLRNKLRIGIDSLPEVRFEAWEEERDEPDEEEAREIQRLCLTVGVYLGPDDDYVDCLTYCNVSDGVDYKYFAYPGKIVAGKQGKKGSYCLPNDAAICNENTSIVVYGKDGWRCFPQMRAFAGEGGNKIVCCDGNLLDRATGKVWRNYIDPSLRLTDVDETLPDGTYRFVCPGGTDAIKNKLIESPMDRLHLLTNNCAKLIPYANTEIRPNFNTGECICGPDNLATYHEDWKTCVPPIAVKVEKFEFPVDRKKCVERWTTYGEFLRTREKETGQYALICGIENDSVKISYPSVNVERALTVDRLTPSPYALREHFASTKPSITDK